MCEKVNTHSLSLSLSLSMQWQQLRTTRGSAERRDRGGGGRKRTAGRTQMKHQGALLSKPYVRPVILELGWGSLVPTRPLWSPSSGAHEAARNYRSGKSQARGGVGWGRAACECGSGKEGKGLPFLGQGHAKCQLKTPADVRACHAVGNTVKGRTLNDATRASRHTHTHTHTPTHTHNSTETSKK